MYGYILNFFSLDDVNLMSFEDLETEDESSQDSTKHVVILAKHIDKHNIQDTNYTEEPVNHTEQTNYHHEQQHKSYNLRNKSTQF